eukprot:TRINITY_DN12570_c0_g1_i2.p1 TRINITY_DN12570_c0_g1~~TRINITY_DN12570_c0_g1_i2.p1  ORF type:complete len:571 (+),score=72.45 TRINITY_DN12570_c0_g1_i2:74-1786(+)
MSTPRKSARKGRRSGGSRKGSSTGSLGRKKKVNGYVTKPFAFGGLDYDEKIRTVAKKHQGREMIILGKYELTKRVGKGAFGVVYKAFEFETEEYVAIKRMSKEDIDEAALSNLSREIDLLKRLDHPNIVKYVALVESDNHVNLILEYIEAGSLLHLLKEFGDMPEAIISVYIKQVLNGLKYLHSEKVIHRDIKASNILITSEGVIKLADFGIATTEQTNKSNRETLDLDSSFLLGSPFWLAPEVIELGPPSPACDIWSVACTVTELLTGKPPYFDLQAMSAMYKIVQEDMPIPEKISSDLADFYTQCFSKKPEKRPTARQLLRHPWIRHAKSTPRSEEKGKAIQKKLLQIKGSKISSGSSISSSLPNKTRKGLENINWAGNRDNRSISDFEEPSGGSDGSESSGSWSKVSTGFRSPRVDMRPRFESVSSDSTVQYIVAITGFETKKSTLFSYTVFKLNVIFGSDSWTVYKTYSDFQQWYKMLTIRASRHCTMPRFPPNKFGADRSPSFVKKRKDRLQEFLDKVLSISVLLRTGLITNFLKEDGEDASTRGAESADETPSKEGRVKSPKSK